MSLTNARQTHFAAAALLRRAKKGNDVTLFAYSFDHPTVTSGILDAVYQGAKVSSYMDYGYVCGDSKSKYGKKTLINALTSAARAPWPGRLFVFSQTGGSVKTAYGRHGRGVSSSVGLGACHAKVLYMYPYLMTGSTNWSVSSEANQELSLILEVQDQETRNYVEANLQLMKSGAVQQCAASIAASQRGGAVG